MSRLKNGTITIEEFYGGTKLLNTPRLGDLAGQLLTMNSGPIKLHEPTNPDFIHQVPAPLPLTLDMQLKAGSYRP